MVSHGGYGHTGMQPMDTQMDLDPNMNFDVNPTLQNNQQQGQQGQVGNW